MNDFDYLCDEETLQLLKLYLAKATSDSHDSNCLNCGKLGVSSDHEINCKCTASNRISRHQEVVDAIISGIKKDKFPKPVFKCLDNLIANGGRPDIEFYIKGDKYILDVVYAHDSFLEHAFNDKINKY